MAYISKEDAEPVLKPHIPNLLACIVEAFALSMEMPYRIDFESRTKSTILRDLIVRKVKEKFEEVPEATPFYTPHYFFLRIENFLIRVKKLDRNNLPNNVRTKQAVALTEQQFVIPETDGSVLLNLGYKINSARTKITSAFLTCQRGRTNEWDIPLGGTAEGFIVLPTQPSFDEYMNIRPRKELIRKEETRDSLQSKS